MSRKLVIVESPAKARTINRFIGTGSQVMACMGHVRDLPPRSMGVDIADHFRPQYELTPNGKKTISKLKEAARGAEQIYLATDPDREGEAIAWHLQEALKKHTKAEFYRVTFHEITRDAIRKAFEDPASLDLKKVDAQQARRILDRLVGYKVSPLLWKNIQKGTSAGRVQSVALRMVCDRERSIQAFDPQEYWNLTGHFLARGNDQTFKADLVKVDGGKPQVPDANTANAFAGELEQADFHIALQRKRKKRQKPSPPFITSTMQQTAGSVARFSTRQTMQIAQQLYEGIDAGNGETTGLITYMRTDSVSISKEAQHNAAAYVKQAFGAEYVPPKPNIYRSGRGAQEAHEAIRPTDVTCTPDKMAAYLNPAQLKLYRLIWTRFVASQMAPAQLLEHTVEVATVEAPGLKHSYLFRATESKVTFPGFKKVYEKERSELKRPDRKTNMLPEVGDGTPCSLASLEKDQKFTEPPKRFTEATLVRELEQKGVGRPSTYAAIIDTIQKRVYVEKERGALIPTELGFHINDYLVQTVNELFQVKFTADMEAELDCIEEGKLESTKMLEQFYKQFRSWVKDVELITAPPPAIIKEFIAIFPDNINWREAVKRGRQTFDDKKFFASLKQQAVEKDKKLSDKQWQALLALAARYADQIPGIWDKADELEIRRELDLLVSNENDEPAQQSATPKPSEETITLLEKLKMVSDWADPVKKGSKTFDDKEFASSLREQAEGGKELTLAQKKVLRNLVVKYRDQLDNFDELADKFGLKIPVKKEAADPQTAAQIVELLSGIQEWEPPKKRGRRTYDDKQFADSLIKQYKDRNSLSVKQAEAARKLLAKYKNQIKNYNDIAGRLNLPVETEETSPDEPCPQCGGDLKLRQSKRGKFYGCANFPKCRFTKPVETQ